MGDSVRPRLQERDQWRERTAAARRGVRRSWSTSDWQCNQAMSQETASLHCSWRRTFRTCSFNITHIFIEIQLVIIWGKMKSFVAQTVYFDFQILPFLSRRHSELSWQCVVKTMLKFSLRSHKIWQISKGLFSVATLRGDVVIAQEISKIICFCWGAFCPAWNHWGAYGAPIPSGRLWSGWVGRLSHESGRIFSLRPRYKRKISRTV